MEPASAEGYSTRLAAEIRSCLARSDTTQRALAAAIGISRQSLSRKLHSRSTFTVEELHAVAGHLGLPTSELLRRAEEAVAA